MLFASGKLKFIAAGIRRQVKSFPPDLVVYIETSYTCRGRKVYVNKGRSLKTATSSDVIYVPLYGSMESFVFARQEIGFLL